MTYKFLCFIVGIYLFTQIMMIFILIILVNFCNFRAASKIYIVFYNYIIYCILICNIYCILVRTVYKSIRTFIGTIYDYIIYVIHFDISLTLERQVIIAIILIKFGIILNLYIRGDRKTI